MRVLAEGLATVVLFLVGMFCLVQGTFALCDWVSVNWPQPMTGRAP